MGDNYEDLGPANVMPPPPPFGQYFVPAASSQTPTDRTELKSAQIGASGAKDNKEVTERTGKGRIPKQTLVSAAVDYDDEGSKYTIAQKRCMVISGIMAIFFFMAAVAAIVVLITDFRIFP